MIELQSLTLSSTGFMKEFFEKTGNTDLKFKPAYNPYTEVRHGYKYAVNPHLM